MKISTVAIALVAAVALAAPAEAAKKRKQVRHAQKQAIVQNDPYAVIDYDGRVAGRDPDPNIRAAIRKDPRPWEGID